MATPRHGHQKRMNAMKVLFEFGFTNPEIAQILGVSTDTIVADRRATNIVHTEPRNSKARFLRMVSEYAELVTDRRFMRERRDMNPDTVTMLKRGLEMVLRIPEILAALHGAETAAEISATTNPRAVCYHAILAAVFGLRATQYTAINAKEFFEEYLLKLYQHELPLPDSSDALRDGMLSAYLRQEMIGIKPLWTEQTAHLIIELLDELIATFTPKEQRVLEFRFGLKGEFKTLKQMGAYLGNAPERIRQIEQVALRKLKHHSRSLYLRILTESSAQLLECGLQQTIHALHEEKAKKLLDDINRGHKVVNFTAAQFQALARSVDEIEISVRAYNTLKNAGIKNIWELVQNNERDMLRSRNFGRKSIGEIKEILAKMGLHLDTHFDDAIRQAYEALTKR